MRPRGAGGQCRVEDAEAHPQGFVLKAVTATESSNANRRCINLLRRKDEIEEFPKHTPMRFDEFAVHAGEVDLAQVDGRLRMGETPGDNGEDAGALFSQFEGTQGAFCEPGEKRGLPVAGELDHGGKLPGFLPLANQPERILQRVNPDFCRKFIGSQNAVVDAAPDNPVLFCCAGELGNPVAHFGKRVA